MNTMFDEREKAFERRFVHEEEMRFRARVRRNRLLAAWACGRMEFPGALAERYIESLVEFGISASDEALIERLRGDLRAAGLEADPSDLRREMERCATLAQAEQHAALTSERP